MKRTIEILFSDRCPYVATAIERVLTLLRRRKPHHDIEVRFVHVDTLAHQARRLRLGPTVACYDTRNETVVRYDARKQTAVPLDALARALGL